MNRKGNCRRVGLFGAWACLSALGCAESEGDAGAASKTVIFYKTINDPEAPLVGIRAAELVDGVAVGRSDLLASFRTDTDFDDPVVTLGPGEAWFLTAWTPGHDLVVDKADCPTFDPDALASLAPRSGAGCSPQGEVTGAKASGVFDPGNGDAYVLFSGSGGVNLARLSAGGTSAADVCLVAAPAAVEDLGVGEAAEVLSGQSVGLRLADPALVEAGDGAPG